MSTPSPIVQLNGAGAGLAVNVTGGSTVTGALASTAGANFFGVTIVSCDDQNTVAAITATLTVNTGAKTFSFTAPASAGSCVVIQIQVGVIGLGLDANGVVQSSFTTTTQINVLTTGGNAVLAVNERSEYDATFGWIKKINTAIRVPPTGSFGQTNLSLANGLNSNVNTGGLPVVRIGGPTAAFSIDGFVAPSATQPNRITVWNTTAYAMTIVHQGSGSTAANRITTIRGVNVTPVLRGGSSCDLVYDSTLARWVLTSSGYGDPKTLDPRDYGALFDGSTDDTAAWTSTFTAAAAASGPVSIEVPTGVSIVKPTSNGQTLFTVPSNVRIQGQGRWTSTIRVSGSTTVDYNAIFGVSSTTGVQFAHLSIDQNPHAGNATPNGSQYAIVGTNVTDFQAYECTLIYCGANAINIGAASSDIALWRNRFVWSSAISTLYDNSTVYIHASGQSIWGNVLIAPTAAPANNTLPTALCGLELHLGPAAVTGNTIDYFNVGMNIVSADGLVDGSPSSVASAGWAICGNTVRGSNSGIVLWGLHQSGNTYTLANVTISGNTLLVNQNRWNAYAPLGNSSTGIQFQYNVSVSAGVYQNIKITGNTIVFDLPNGTLFSNGTSNVWLTPGQFNNLCAGVAMYTPGTVYGLTIEDNTVVNSPGKGVSIDSYFADVVCQNSVVRGNTFVNNGTDYTGLSGIQRAGVFVNRTVTGLLVEHNTSIYDSTYSTGSQQPYWLYVSSASPTNVQVGTNRLINTSSATPAYYVVSNSHVYDGITLPASSSSIQFGPSGNAQSGNLRFPAGVTGAMTVRNAGGSADLSIVGDAGTSNIVLGDPGMTSISVRSPLVRVAPNGSGDTVAWGPTGFQFFGVGIPCGAGGTIAAANYATPRLAPIGTLPSDTTIQVNVAPVSGPSQDVMFIVDTTGLTFAGHKLFFQVGSAGATWGGPALAAGITAAGYFLMFYSVGGNKFYGVSLT